MRKNYEIIGGFIFGVFLWNIILLSVTTVKDEEPAPEMVPDNIRIIEKTFYYYKEPKDWVNDSTISTRRRFIYDHLIKE